MSDTEFDIIRRYFTRQDSRRRDVIAGIGDDAALLQVPAGMELVVCMDTLVEGVHFPIGTPAAAIGHKALAVNLSDLAAMGAEPAWATLSLTIPESDPDWLADFSQAFFKLADRYQVQLVGGDTTRGPLAVTVQAHGFVPESLALRRQGAQAGDHIYVTGTLGDAGLALQLAGDAGNELQHQLDYPEPRIAAGQALRGIASAAIDVSDGLFGDLRKLLSASGVGGEIDIDVVPLSAQLREAFAAEDQQRFALSGGDDYELCFTSAEELQNEVAGVRITAIGKVTEGNDLLCRDANGIVDFEDSGYLHFQ